MTASKIFRPTAGLAIAALYTAASFGIVTTPAEAKAPEVFYRAELAQPVSEGRTEIVRGVMWRCEGTKCIGTQGRSRAVIDCERFAREFGEVTAFSAKDEALDAADLARCNG
ncbi:hypothetical protein QQS45_07055 [Alteriqipengyuania flavescens]|uniref:CC_3452 family protein n=1 Tax=Alteriqipengyuania flavescens TaxID=3053610 RepID=UPI0025B5F92A|nr:hypothetical protein [Alteriqipengyuania flavescens]WJY17431.1 hypothetical protein QQW98_07045 [Alteriqipengyuania flavescens]WJY23374.1 hypothetical protein QQS45_07055 [Alteriqipengyuania flavescens]